ncbi:MAG: ABC-F family ATP-binding cassette domain-containing protein [Lentisphaeria bacterium]|jgi:ATP-binding cassette subfamily F protein uup
MPPPTPVLLTARDLRFRINAQVILDGVSLTIHDGDRLGLIGRNGAGKTTLLKILAAAEPPDSGEVLPRRGLRLGWLPQESGLRPEATVRNNILDGARDVLALLARYEALPHDTTEAHEIEHQLLLLDGWNLESRLAEVASHLEAPPLDRPAHTLSGGERRRVALCRALIGRPDLLILDEPTNHLDTESIEWLELWLRRAGGACLMVTHDRYFLDRVVTRTIELANGTLFSHEGNYLSFLEAKARREAEAGAADAKRQAFLRRELDWIRRGPKARTTKSQSRIARFNAAAAQKAPDQERDVEMILPPPPPLGNRVVELHNLTLERGGRTLLRNLALEIPAGAKIGVVGRNGTGKTTLLRTILGELAPAAGSVFTDPKVRFNVIDQHRLQLDDAKTVLQEVGDGQESLRLGNTSVSVWSYLRRFLFADDRINTAVGKLSGGERSRLLMAKILKNGGNFLVLDEPTNDLDLATLRILEEALAEFPGCVLIVSHDRWFLNRICTGILAIEADGQTFYQPGDYDYYREKREARRRAAAASASEAPPGRAAEEAPPTAAASASAPPPPKRALKWKELKELEGMEAAIEAAEAEVARLEALFAAPDFFARHGAQARELTDQLAAARAAAERLYARWAELEAWRGEACKQ